MVAFLLCPACLEGRHDEHVEDYAPAPEGVMGGFRCPCKGGCTPVRTFTPFDPATTTGRAIQNVIAAAGTMMAEDDERAEIADAAYMKGRSDALGAPLNVEKIALLSEVWMPIERALVAQDRIAGPPEDNHDPHVTMAPEPRDVALAVLRAAEPKLRALWASSGVRSDTTSQESGR
jgi:hypothetical protein